MEAAAADLAAKCSKATDLAVAVSHRRSLGISTPVERRHFFLGWLTTMCLKACIATIWVSLVVGCAHAASEIRQWVGEGGAHVTLAATTRFRLAFLGLVLILGACASVPLSTMARMATFDERGFATLNADEVRVKITVPEGFGIDAKRSRLDVEVTSSVRSYVGAFELEEERNEPRTIPGGIFSEPTEGTAFVLRLSGPSRQKFRDLQRFVKPSQTDKIKLNVAAVLSTAPAEATEVTFWVDVLLSQRQGYFVLLDAVTMPRRSAKKESDR